MIIWRQCKRGIEHKDTLGLSFSNWLNWLFVCEGGLKSFAKVAITYCTSPITIILSFVFCLSPLLIALFDIITIVSRSLHSQSRAFDHSNLHVWIGVFPCGNSLNFFFLLFFFFSSRSYFAVFPAIRGVSPIQPSTSSTIYISIYCLPAVYCIYIYIYTYSYCNLSSTSTYSHTWNSISHEWNMLYRWEGVGIYRECMGQHSTSTNTNNEAIVAISTP